MAGVDALAEPCARKELKEEFNDIGSVTDFIELINATVGKHFKCCICFSILEDPVMLPCNHPLCRGCATQCLKQNQRCPQCLAAIPNLRMLQGRNGWIAEMVISLKSCLNEVGVSLTQHAPVPPKYRDNPPPAPGAAGVEARRRARAQALTSSERARRAQRSTSCGGGSSGGGGSGGGHRGGGGRRGRREARRKGKGRGGGRGGGGGSGSSRERSAPVPAETASLSSSDDEIAADAPSLPPSSSQSPSPPPAPQRPFVVGDLVLVEPRTWPGMNKHGGVAFVTAVLDPPGYRYDVKYSVGGKTDRAVEARYVHEYAFPEETVGSRSRRRSGGSDSRASKLSGGGGSFGSMSLPPRGRSRRRSGGSDSRASKLSGGGGSFGSMSLPPRGRPRTPAAAATVGAGTDNSSSTTASTAAAATPTAKTPAPRRVVENIGRTEQATDEADLERKHTAISASPCVLSTARASKAPNREGGHEGRGGDRGVLRELGDDEISCDDAGEVSCQLDAASTIRDEGAEGGASAGDSSDNGSVREYGGASLDDEHDRHGDGEGCDNFDGDVDGGRIGDESDAAGSGGPGQRGWGYQDRSAPGGASDGDWGGAACAEELSSFDVTKSERDEGDEPEEEEEATRDEDKKGFTHDGATSHLLSAAGSESSGGVVCGGAAPISPSSRSNLPWCPPEESRAGHLWPRDPLSSSHGSSARDSMLAGAAEGLMALAANRNTAASPPATAGIARRGEGSSDIDVISVDGDEARIPTRSLPRPSRNSPAVGTDAGGGSPGEAIALAAAARPPPGGPATAAAFGNGLKVTTAFSSLRSSGRSSTCPDQQKQQQQQQQQHLDGYDTNVRAVGSRRESGHGDGPDLGRPAPPVSSTGPQLPIPSRGPSEVAEAGPQRRQRQAMPPPPPSFPSPISTCPSSGSLPTAWTPMPPPPPPLLPSPRTTSFDVGDLVSVPSRSSPGVNKEGGVAKVTLAHPDGTFDVKYIVRQGREKRVSPAILSPYAVGDEVLYNGGGGSTRVSRNGTGRGSDTGASGSSSSLSSPHTAAASSANGPPTLTVRRTPRANKGWCSPDLAAGQANAAYLNYMLGDTQHPELDLDPDLGKLLDPDEGSSNGSGDKSSTNVPAGKARKQKRETVSSWAAAGAAVDAAAAEGGEADEEVGESGEGSVISPWHIRDGSDGEPGRSRGDGKRKRLAHDGGGDGSDEGVSDRDEQQVAGDTHGGSAQAVGRGRRRRRSNSEGCGTGGGRGGGGGDIVFDISALDAASFSGDNAAEPSSAAAAAMGPPSAGGNGRGDNVATTASFWKRGRSPKGGGAVPRAAAAAAAAAVTETAVKKKKSSGKSTALATKAGSDGTRGGGAGLSVNGRRGRAAAAAEATEAEGPVVLTISGSTTEVSKLADSLAKSLGWKMEPKYTDEVTHVVCGTVEKNAKAKVRSVKFLRAVAGGKWIVTEAWLHECRRRHARAAEEPFEVAGDRKSSVPSAPRRSRMAHAEEGRPGLFQGITFHFRGQFGTTGSPPLSELESMLLANGAQVVSTIGALFTRRDVAEVEAGREGGRGGGGGVEAGIGQRGSGSGSGGWRPRRVVIFQPSAADPDEDARVLAEELASLAEAELSRQGSTSEGPGARDVSGSGSRLDKAVAVEVVKPIWLVDSVGCFRVLRPSVHHRLPILEGTRES